MADNDRDLPKQELLIKLLRMTTSDNDGEALTALRKANAFLNAAGWDWERLIHGKIRIIEDPFKNLGTPPNRFAGFCYCCGDECVANAGLIFKPSQYNSQASNDWKIACTSCNVSAHVASFAAARKRPARGSRPFVTDLS